MIFADRSQMRWHGKRSEFSEMIPECATIFTVGDYTVKMFHQPVGIGLSDRYTYNTEAEVYKNDDICTSEIANKLDIKLPISSKKDINSLMRWIYNNA